MPGPVIRRLTDPDDPAIGPFEEIYAEALPGPERKPLQWLREIVGQARAPALRAGEPEYRLLVAESDHKVLGFAILFVPESPHDATLLEYLAVDKSARGGGVGGMLLRHSGNVSARPMLVEIETSDPCADRRRRFYERHGCRAVMGLQYLLPLPGAGPMELMVAGTDRVSRADLTHWLETIYAEVYGQPRDDPRVARMTRTLSNQVLLDPPQAT